MSEGLRIGHVARVVGIPTTTLRAWEKRYGIVVPVRSGSSGYRGYLPADVDRLRHMRALVESGIAPNRAAAIVATTPRAEEQSGPKLQGLLDDHDALVRAGAFYDGAELDALLDAALAEPDVEEALERWLMPSMRAVGEAWASGRIPVLVEHYIAAAVMRRLGRLFDAAPAVGPRVVVGLPPDCHHEISALAFSVCLRRRGVDVLYAGADVPLDSWRRLAAEWAPRTVVMVATMPDDAVNASAACAVLHDAGVPQVYVGGKHAVDVPSAIPLPLSMSASTEVVVASRLR
ncbi:MerR family transcriptional regulator [Gordonia sp. PDNC005]|uniref:MerR family transcriptional regulator n=1 Tax=unclassified Gordonia (in: high G+C Gram-positive bacteria) TaxID=2657482 RepID=UPI0019633F39|nr:MerR family transcriptional regulator [Gordonia sp. PDNC005]QRY62004.1 MerR family transcriptional regulator [Gordonia sp. PDNC005]